MKLFLSSLSLSSIILSLSATTKNELGNAQAFTASLQPPVRIIVDSPASLSAFSASIYDGDNADDDNCSSFSMADLQQRMLQVSDSEKTLPLVVLDAMLPRQVLRISVRNDLLIKLVRTRLQQEKPTFGMLGKARLQNGQSVHLRSGVEVEIVGKPEIREKGQISLVLRAGRRFRIQEDSVESQPGQGWTTAKVDFVYSAKEEANEKKNDTMSIARAMQICQEFHNPNKSLGEDNKSLVEMWVELAKTKERMPGQIDRLLEDIGPIPSWEEPSECALWIGALINPTPALGVARELRPKLLVAKTAEERAQIALDGIWHSIQLMKGPRIEKIKE
jgi:Lon protease-like protein